MNARLVGHPAGVPMRVMCVPGRHDSPALDGDSLPEGWALVPAEPHNGGPWKYTFDSLAMIVVCPKHLNDLLRLDAQMSRWSLTAHIERPGQPDEYLFDVRGIDVQGYGNLLTEMDTLLVKVVGRVDVTARTRIEKDVDRKGGTIRWEWTRLDSGVEMEVRATARRTA